MCKDNLVPTCAGTPVDCMFINANYLATELTQQPLITLSLWGSSLCQPFCYRDRNIPGGNSRGCSWYWMINTLRPRQNSRHFPDDILKWILFNGNVWISIRISLRWSNNQYSSVVSDNGLAPIWRHAIIRDNDGLAYWLIHASLDLNKLRLILVCHEERLAQSKF